MGAWRINMSDGIKAEPFSIGGILVWKIINLKDNSVIAQGPTVNDAVKKAIDNTEREEEIEE